LDGKKGQFAMDEILNLLDDLIRHIQAAPLQGSDQQKENYHTDLYRKIEKLRALGVEIDPTTFRFKKYVMWEIDKMIQKSFGTPCFDAELEPLRKLRARAELGLPLSQTSGPKADSGFQCIGDGDAAAVKITENEKKILSCLAEHPDLIQSQADIEAGVYLSRKTIRRLLQSLQQKGLIEKHPRGVAITPKGVELAR